MLDWIYVYCTVDFDLKYLALIALGRRELKFRPPYRCFNEPLNGICTPVRYLI